MLPNLTIADEIMQRITALADFSEAADMLTRTYMTPCHRAAAAQIAALMSASGLTVRHDAAGNVIGRYEGMDPARRALVTGSHYDTVRNAGRYDGPLGIVLPLVCIAAWSKAGRRFDFPIEVIAFAEEEGVQFKATLLGSRAIAGTFDSAVLGNRDDAGMTMADAMLKSGFDPAAIPSAARRREDIAAFVEVHIEQGPVLLEAGLALGVVTAISGATRLMLELEGIAGHAGTVPMAMRHDAAMAGAEIGLFIEKRCREADGLVGTVGQFTVPNGAANVIPGLAHLSIDVRAGDDTARLQAVADILAEVEVISHRRGIRAVSRKTYEAASVSCADSLQQQLAASITRCGMDVRHLPSGAGHDGIAMAAITDVAMLFVRCGNGGISHHPDETMTVDDIDIAAKAFMDFVEHFRADDVLQTKGPQ